MKIQKARNPDSLTSFEQMHLPWIIIPEFIKKGEKFEAIIKVGKVDHPMKNEHHISGIQLCVNSGCFERKMLDLTDHSEAKFKIILEKDSTITARAECNLHGAWESKNKIILYRGNNINI